jgi:sialate O-acetylesterase
MEWSYDKIIVWNQIPGQPMFVRPGFGSTSVGNVFGKAVLPLVPFRTDAWQVNQEPQNSKMDYIVEVL